MQLYHHFKLSLVLLLVGSIAVVSGCCAAAPRVEKDITFTTASGQQLKLDIYRPENDATSHPVVLLIHGGGWAGGDKSAHAYIGRPMAEHGYLAISANYRLAPKFQYPDGVEDCQAAMRWVRAHAADYGGDVTRLGMLGESAGGHLVSLLGLWDWTTTGTAAQSANDSNRVRAVVNLFGPSDLAAFDGIPFCQKLVKDFLGGTTETVPQLYRDVSPIHLLDSPVIVSKPGPAFLHIHGTKDVLVPVDQTRRFHQRLKDSGFDSTALFLEGANHGWKPDSEDGKRARAATFELLDRVLEPQQEKPATMGEESHTTASHYYAHAAVEDGYGVIAPWYTGQNGQLDLRVRIAAETLKRYPWADPGDGLSPAPHYIYNGQWRISPDGKIGIPGDDDATTTGEQTRNWDNGDLSPRAARLIFAMEEYYRYSGDPFAFGQIKLAADNILQHCVTPPDHDWPGIVISSPVKGKPYGVCGVHGFIQLDDVAEMGVALLHAYKMTGDRTYFDAALRWGQLYARKCDTSETARPWPRYANPQDVKWGKEPDGNIMTGGASYPTTLLDELIAMPEVTDKLQLIPARDAGERYLQQLLPKWVEDPTWGYNYWDNKAAYSNQNVVYWVSQYMMNHPDKFPNWPTDIRNLMTIMLDRTSTNPQGRNGVWSGAWVHTESRGCCGDSNGYGPQRSCGLFLRYAKQANSEWARELGRRMAILSTYDITDTGYIVDGLLSNKSVVANRWFKIAVLNPILFMIRDMAWLPEHLAPNRENHLLRSSSTVQSIRYGDGDLAYKLYAAPAGGIDVLRLSFVPKDVLADDKALSRTLDLKRNGYTVEELQGGDAILTIRHDGCASIRITGDDPQTVTDANDFNHERDWRETPGNSDFGGSVLVASTPGSTADCKFTGNQFRLVGRCAPDGGRAEVFIDGEKQLCGLECWGPAEKCQQVLYYRGGLASGEHVIRIVVSGDKDPVSKGAKIYLDALQYSAATGDSGTGSGGGPKEAQRFILGYAERQDYVDHVGHKWRPTAEVVCPAARKADAVAQHWWTTPRAPSIEGTIDPELYRYGMHATELKTYFTVGPGRYKLRVLLAETRDDATTSSMNIDVNGVRKADNLNVLAKAGGIRRALDLEYPHIDPRNGVIEVRFTGNDRAEAIAQAIELLPE